MLVRDQGLDAGEHLIAKIQAIVDRPVKRPKPALAFSAAVDADKAVRR